MRASSRKYKYSIAWSAKAGCTTFRRLFLFLHQNELNEEPINEWHRLNEDFPFDISYKKAIVLSRNPYNRVLSAFTNKICGGPGHNTLSKKITLNQVTFKNFLLYLYDRKHNLQNIDIHLVPQFIPSRPFVLDGFDDNHMLKIKLENFNVEILEAYKQLGLQELIPRVRAFLNEKNQFANATQRNDHDQFCGETVYSINDTIFPEGKYFYNEELRELVQKIYPEDFEYFGYKFEE